MPGHSSYLPGYLRQLPVAKNCAENPDDWQVAQGSLKGTVPDVVFPTFKYRTGVHIKNINRSFTVLSIRLCERCWTGGEHPCDRVLIMGCDAVRHLSHYSEVPDPEMKMAGRIPISSGTPAAPDATVRCSGKMRGPAP